ncbi:MAG: PAS domain S-box protein [Myxococcaceae bacterium]
MSIDPATAVQCVSPSVPKDAGWLVVTRSSTPGALGRIFKLAAAEALLGRAPEAEVRLLDEGISRRHARILVAGDGGFELQDLDSTNGTYHNGVRLTGSVRLAEGDKVQLGGNCRLRFSFQQTGDADEDLREALAAAQVGTFGLDVVSSQVTWSESVERVLGAPQGALARSAQRLADFVHPEDLSRVTGALQSAIANRQQFEAEFRFVHPSAPASWVAVRGDVLRNTDDVASRVVGTVMDVSARKQAEDELRRQALLFENLNDAVVLIDLSGLVLDWNTSAERLFGYSKAEAQGRSYRDLLRIEDPEAEPARLHATLKRYGRWHRELAAVRQDGTQCFSEATVVQLRDPEGRHVASLAVHRDIAERRAMQAQLMVASRMASVGTLAAGMAHEINNPLAFINANLVWLRDALEAQRAALGDSSFQELDTVVSEARTGIERIGNIVRDLKAFSRVETDEAAAPVDVRKVLSFAAKMADKELRQRARVVSELEDVPAVLGSEGRLGQVFLNLLLNAAQAIPDGAATSNEIRIRCLHRDRTVVVEVSDTGRGIPEELQARIFDPFFTTKPVGEGTGLGLAVCHGIVRGLGGEISVRSEVGRGSTFSVLLPTQVSAGASSGRSGQAEASRLGVRVLVVDDEPFICSAIQRLLRRDYRVTAVTSAREALELVRAGQRFEVILSDLMMPEMSGEDLVSTLRQVAPDQAARVVIMTGGAFTPRSEEFLRSVRLPHLSKPLTLETLRGAIRNALEAADVAA